MRSSLAARAVVTMAGIGVQGLARFLYTIAIGRILGPEELSEISAILSLAVFLALAWPSGAAIAASRYLPVDGSGRMGRALTRDFLVGGAVLAAVAAPITWVMTQDANATIGAVALTASYSAYVFARGAMLGQARFVGATVLDTISSMVAMGVLVGVLVGGLQPLVLAPLAVGYAVFALIGWPWRQRPTLGTMPPEPDARLRRFVLHTSLAALATGGLLPVTMLVVQLTDTPFAAGLFAAGLSLATPASLASQAINQVLVPHLAAVAEQGPQALRRSHARALAGTSALFAVVFGALIAFASPILDFFYGPQYADGAPAMQALLAVVLLISCMAAPSALLLVMGRERLYARIWMVAFVVGATTMAACAPGLGIAGALVGYAVGAGGGAVSVIVIALVLAARGDQRASIDSNTAA